MIKVNEKTEQVEVNVCSFCKKDLEEEGLGYCDDCYIEITEEIAQLAQMKYTIDNCVRGDTDEQILDDLRTFAQNIIDYVNDLEKKVI